MKIIIKFYGPWQNITSKSGQVMHIKERITLNELLVYLIEEYGKDFENEIKSGSIYLECNDGTFNSIETNDVLAEGSNLIFLGPIVGG
jgi:molybdopterin converting factor small subunit